ncbi:hypothetical protein PYW07_009203 [Mythimna separata]|uniref:Uncharacterized protein n=1 Tax=Mythimna separata TaxID=271217 RepID=A0AAD8DN21_MYTSE|nr:hypothetical protein PYW07_009203 [Mythimna separata]
MELEILHQYSEDDPNIADAKHKLSIIRHQFKQKWSAAHNTNARFLEANKEWLKGTISLPKAGSSGMRVLTRNDLLTIMERSNASTFYEKLEFMELEILHQYSEDDPNIADAKHKLSIIRHQFKQKWSAAHNTNARFLEANKEWLKGTISLPKAVMKWRARLTAEEKKLVETRKKEIQTKFREQLGLLVDIPKANFGNTNDGNTSRRFFDEYEKSAEITGIDQNLIYRLKVILETMCCGIKINIEKFEIYCKETAELYVSLYKFHPIAAHPLTFILAGIYNPYGMNASGFARAIHPVAKDATRSVIKLVPVYLSGVIERSFVIILCLSSFRKDKMDSQEVDDKGDIRNVPKHIIK